MPFACFARSAFLLAICFAVTSLTHAESPTLWPQWRGGAQNGVANDGAYPLQWTDSDHVAWKVDIPGLGGSTPVTAGSRAFLTSGDAGKNQLIAVDTDSGKIQWKTVIGDDMGKKHKKGGGSNPSPVTDGESVFAFFRSGDLGCVSPEGELLWQKNIQYDAKDGLWWDLGTSPLLTNNAVVITVMHSGPSYLVAFDKKTGKQLWKADRGVPAPKESAQSYTTPLNVQVNGKDAIAVFGADHLTLHASEDGRELGRLGGFNPKQDGFYRSIASPAAEGNIIVCPYARGGTMTAVDMDKLANGVGKDAIVWFRDDVGADVPTPAIQDGRVYVLGDKKARGRVTCADLKTGETIWQVQLQKSRADYSSSPLIAGDHLYLTQEDAKTHVVGPLSSDKPKIVSSNELDDTEQYTVASPVPYKDALLIRSKHKLYRITKN